MKATETLSKKVSARLTEKQIYDNRIAAEKKFSQTIKQLEIDSIKDKYVLRMKQHIEADELVRGIGFEGGKG